MCENDGKKRNIELSFLITYQDAFHLKIALLGYTPYVGVYIRAGDIFFEKASVGLRCKVLLRLVFASSLPDLAGFAKKNRDDCTVVSVFFCKSYGSFDIFFICYREVQTRNRNRGLPHFQLRRAHCAKAGCFLQWKARSRCRPLHVYEGYPHGNIDPK